MNSHHVVEGISLLAVTLAFMGVGYFRAPKQRRLPAQGWAGLATIILAELLLILHQAQVATFFTPIAWTGYLFWVDGMVSSLSGPSRLERSPAEFLSLAFWSVPLWLIFEAYNLRLENWAYVGLPENPLVRGIGYVWSFATIWPAIFETADFVQALQLFRAPAKPHLAVGRSTRLSLAVLGVACVAAPVLVPVRAGRYLFGAVWVGFILLLDPLNYAWKRRSLLRDFERGEPSSFWSFFAAGWFCGMLWEFWNYWAAAKWLYVFPIGQGSKVFEMPLVGYLGFPAFALECLVMYEFLRGLKNQFLRLWGSQTWEAAGSSS